MQLFHKTTGYFSYTLVFLHLFIAHFANGQQDLLKTELKNLSKDKSFKNASISFLAVDVSTGTTIAKHNADLSIVPASTMKVVSTATALEVFGPKHRFTTTIEYDGTIDAANRVLKGNLYIHGGGDPTLGSENFSAVYGNFIDEWVVAVKALNIDSISGYVIGDAQYFNDNVIPGAWIWSDIGNYYGSGPCGLTCYENTYKLNLKSGLNDGDPTVVLGTEPVIPGLKFDNKIKASNRNVDNGYIYGSPYTYHRILDGTIPKNRQKFTIKGAIPDPSLFITQQLHKKLTDKGIKVKNGPLTMRILRLEDATPEGNRTKIFTTNSPTLKAIVNRTNKRSVNIYAEHLLMHVGIKLGAKHSTEAATDALSGYWSGKGVSLKGFFPNDGSGLSRKTNLTSRNLVNILKYVHKSTRSKEAFYESLPVAGKSGTLRSMCKGTAGFGRVHAKSGSMSRVRSYAGYVESSTGKTIVFAVIVNNYTCSNSVTKKKIARLMDLMAGS